jgi:hypothetical protein
MHVFKSHVIHNAVNFVKGQACPKELHDDMAKKGLIEALPEAVKPVEPPKAAEAPKAEAKK